MVHPLEDRPDVFLCDECGLGYASEAVARRCEAYCKEHQSCSIEITRDAVYP